MEEIEKWSVWVLSPSLSPVCMLMSDGILLILTVSIANSVPDRSHYYDDLLFGHRCTPLFPVGKIVGWIRAHRNAINKITIQNISWNIYRIFSLLVRIFFLFLNKFFEKYRAFKILPVRGSTVSSRDRARNAALPGGVTVGDRCYGSGRGSSVGSRSAGPAGEAEHHGEEVVQVRVVLPTATPFERDEGNGWLVVVVLVLVVLFVVLHHDHRCLLRLFPMLRLGTTRLGHFCVRDDWLRGRGHRGCLRHGSRFRFRLLLRSNYLFGIFSFKLSCILNIRSNVRSF